MPSSFCLLRNKAWSDTSAGAHSTRRHVSMRDQKYSPNKNYYGAVCATALSERLLEVGDELLHYGAEAESMYFVRKSIRADTDSAIVVHFYFGAMHRETPLVRSTRQVQACESTSWH
eukprot:4986182-Amphidinium_carterae.1